MLALLPHGDGGCCEKGIVERAQGNRDKPLELALDRVMDGRAVLGTEMVGGAVATVGHWDQVSD